MKSLILFFTVIIGFTFCTPDETCRSVVPKDCDSCLKIKGCAFCKDTKVCFAYDVTSKPKDCSVSQLQYQTCIGNAQLWLIIFGSVGGALLVATVIIVWCCCRRCKQRAENRDIIRYNADTQKLEERRGAADVRTADRKHAADQIRLKYGLPMRNE